jgi:hypothetical protein
MQYAIMPVFAPAMLIVFIAGEFVAVGGWFYGTRYLYPMWSNGQALELPSIA